MHIYLLPLSEFDGSHPVLNWFSLKEFDYKSIQYIIRCLKWKIKIGCKLISLWSRFGYLGLSIDNFLWFRNSSYQRFRLSYQDLCRNISVLASKMKMEGFWKQLQQKRFTLKFCNRNSSSLIKWITHQCHLIETDQNLIE